MNDEAKKVFLAQLPKFDPKDSEIYNATCHCGSIRYTVTLSPPLEHHPIVSCNCSICFKNGYLLVYPTRERVAFGSGEDKLKSYSFGNKRNQHKFCAGCGGSLFFDPELTNTEGVPDLLGINVLILPRFVAAILILAQIRMFQGVNLEGLNLVRVDGYNLHPFVGDTAHLQQANA